MCDAENHLDLRRRGVLVPKEELASLTQCGNYVQLLSHFLPKIS